MFITSGVVNPANPSSRWRSSSLDAVTDPSRQDATTSARGVRKKAREAGVHWDGVVGGGAGQEAAYPRVV